MGGSFLFYEESFTKSSYVQKKLNIICSSQNYTNKVRHAVGGGMRNEKAS
jgi:hypothetical protein